MSTHREQGSRTFELTAVENIWRVLFNENLAMSAETFIANSVLSAAFITGFFEHVTIDEPQTSTTLEEFEQWLVDGKIAITERFGQSVSKDSTFEHEMHLRLLAMAVGHARLHLAAYIDVDYPFGRSVEGLREWLVSGTEDGAVSMTMDAVRNEFYEEDTEREHQGGDLAHEAETSAASDDNSSYKEAYLVTERPDHQQVEEVIAVTENIWVGSADTDLSSELHRLRPQMIRESVDQSTLFSYECAPYGGDTLADGPNTPDRLNDEFYLVVHANGRTMQISLRMNESNELGRLHATILQRLRSTAIFLLGASVEASEILNLSAEKSP